MSAPPDLDDTTAIAPETKDKQITDETHKNQTADATSSKIESMFKKIEVKHHEGLDVYTAYFGVHLAKLENAVLSDDERIITTTIDGEGSSITATKAEAEHLLEVWKEQVVERRKSQEEFHAKIREGLGPQWKGEPDIL
ncbi:hypothetical protein H2199_007602 [Coniosporium tulheliwenetii]|nr:hypothetical protein H2199_007602 [Cladosporium sp. JES 115]